MTRYLRGLLAVTVVLIAALLALTQTAYAQGSTVIPVMPTVNGQVCDRSTGVTSAPDIVFVDDGSGIEYYDVSVSGSQSVYSPMEITAKAKLPEGKSWGDLPAGETSIETSSGTLYGQWRNPWGGDPHGEYLSFEGELHEDFCRIQIVLVPDMPTVTDYTCRNGFLVPVVTLPANSEYIEYTMGENTDSWNFQVWARLGDAAYALPPLEYDIIWQVPAGNDLGQWIQFYESSEPYFEGSIGQTPCDDEEEPTISPRAPYVCTLRFDDLISDFRVASLSPADAYEMGWISWSEELNDYVLPGDSDKFIWCDTVPNGRIGEETPPVVTETPIVTETPVVTETPAVTETPTVIETPEPGTFTLISATRACEDQSFNATWTGTNIATIEFALSNTSDNWTSGWLSADPAAGSFTTAVDHHAYDKVAARVIFTDDSTQTETADVGTCTKAPTTPEKPSTPSKPGGSSVTSLPVTGAGESESTSYAGLIAATAVLVAAVGCLGTRRQRR